MTVKTKTFKAEDGLYFTSDTHFWHRSILNWRKGFDSLEQMNEVLIHNWNSVVTPKSHVFHLGDVSFGNREKTTNIINQLNGTIHLVKGNHDKNIKSGMLDLFETVQDYLEIDVGEGLNKQRINMSHYPMRSWNKHHYGSWMLHGHCHGNLPGLGKSLDVGIDNNDFMPVSFELIKAYMDQCEIHTCDHHTVKV